MFAFDFRYFRKRRFIREGVELLVVRTHARGSVKLLVESVVLI